MALQESPHPERERSEQSKDAPAQVQSNPEPAAEAMPAFAGSPVMLQYHEIKRAHPGCLLFFRMGDFYELFFEDAVAAAPALDIALTKRGRHNGADIPMCGVPVHTAEAYLARLIRAGFKVAICDQTEDPAAARRRGNKGPGRRAGGRWWGSCPPAPGPRTGCSTRAATTTSPASPRRAARSGSPGSICRPAPSR